MKKSSLLKKLLAVACAGLMMATVLAPTTSAWTNFWKDYGNGKGSSCTDAQEMQYKSAVVALVQSRYDGTVRGRKESQGAARITVTVDGSWLKSSYMGSGYVNF